MSPPHVDTALSNSHKDHQMCSEMQRGGKGEVSRTHCPLSNALSPPSFHPPPLHPTSTLSHPCPPLSPRDMCARCASRQFQLSATDAQTAAVSPFPSFSLPPAVLLSSFSFLPHAASSIHPPLYFPLPFPSALSFCPALFSSGGYKGRSRWRGERGLCNHWLHMSTGELLLQLGKGNITGGDAKTNFGIRRGRREYL